MKSCRWRSPAQKAKAIRRHLRKYGDEIPEADIREATRGKQLSRWETLCDAPGKIAGAMRWTQNDWYLCTLKNAATRKGLRGKGVGGRVYAATARRALRNRSCLVLAADVTSDNVPSIKLLERQGFVRVNRFCWDKNNPPADILHYVKMPPGRGTKGPACR